MKKIDTKEFPALPYAYDALEPYIDARTMEVHYDKHHRAYFNNFVNAIKGTALENTPIEKIFAEVSKAGDAVRNNGGGYYNHVIFWENMGKGSSGPSAELSAAITKAFGSKGYISSRGYVWSKCHHKGLYCMFKVYSRK